MSLVLRVLLRNPFSLSFYYEIVLFLLDLLIFIVFFLFLYSGKIIWNLRCLIFFYWLNKFCMVEQSNVYRWKQMKHNDKQIEVAVKGELVLPLMEIVYKSIDIVISTTITTTKKLLQKIIFCRKLYFIYFSKWVNE